MVELETDVARVERSQALYDIRRGRLRRPEDLARNCLQVGLREAVKLRSELRRPGRRVAKRIYLRGKVAVDTDGIDEGRRSSSLREERSIRLCACLRRERLWKRAAEFFSEAEELAPRLVDRRRVAPI
jgi:hypothetical protein